MRRRRKGSGKTCHYCGRIMAPNGQTGALAQTEDHVWPKSLGGVRTVPCCFTCNNMKGQMTPEQWLAFRQENPRWWELPRARFEMMKPKYLAMAFREGSA